MSAMRKKVLLMGKSGSGKTSMRSIIFANFLARETRRLNPTLDVEHSSVRFLGDLVLSLWDCGGQDQFYESYFESERDSIFKDVELLIYVFDIESAELEKDFRYYSGCIEALKQFSASAKVFCLVHKMDLVAEDRREDALRERSELIIANSLSMDVSCYGTSIWDETLYKAWSNIVYSLIPNVDRLKRHLGEFAEVCDADEVVLFEKVTFLVVSEATRRVHEDHHRFEKISNIVKQFKLSCSNAQSQFQGMRIGNAKFTAFIDSFTSNTYIMVVVSDSRVAPGAIALNISLARDNFERLVADSTSERPATSDAGSAAGGGGGTGAGGSGSGGGGGGGGGGGDETVGAIDDPYA